MVHPFTKQQLTHFIHKFNSDEAVPREYLFKTISPNRYTLWTYFMNILASVQCCVYPVETLDFIISLFRILEVGSEVVWNGVTNSNSVLYFPWIHFGEHNFRISSSRKTIDLWFDIGWVGTMGIHPRNGYLVKSERWRGVDQLLPNLSLKLSKN